ncbi:MAG: nucleoside-diphosphate kinase [Candidatus Aenigmarchaeota archaeon]|nr:nucleoside-diphosphate kinase [Candidatus Aenigmarchaeota archaeon]
MERTLIILKPDAVKRGLEKDIVKRYEKAGLKQVARKELSASVALLRAHYSTHVDKPFYPNLEKFMASGTVVAMVFEGKDAVAAGRKVTGATKPADAEKGTVRGDFRDASLTGEDAITKNMVHASATKEEAEKEIKLWFGKL